MKKLSLALAALALCGAANAGTATGAFAVTVSFASACTVSNSAVVAFGSYTGLNATPNTASANIAVICSRGTSITNVAYTDGTGGYFPTAGLNYVLDAPVVTQPTGGLTASTTSIGTADVGNIVVGGTLPAQAGINNNGNAPANPETVTRILTFTF